MLDYPRFIAAPRVLILETQYFFDKSWLRAAESLGWTATTVSSTMVGSLSREDLATFFTTLAEFKPDFILTSNYAGMDAQGIIPRFLEDVRIPYVSWFTDTPRMILYNRELYNSPYSIAATWERAYTDYFKAIGFQHIHYMPLATDPTLFNAAPTTTHQRQLAFVGTSMAEQCAEAIEKFGHLPHVIPQVMQAFNADKITKETFIQGLECFLPSELLDPLNISERRNLELLINYEATRYQRECLGLALKDADLHVRGDVSWQRILDKDHVQGPLNYFEDLAPYYNSTAINLNSTSLQMPTAVNQRVFDCPAAGGFLITDDQADLYEQFDVLNEVVTYTSHDELIDKTAYYLEHPDERLAITQRARTRILNEHTHAHRLQGLEAFLKECFT